MIIDIDQSLENTEYFASQLLFIGRGILQSQLPGYLLVYLP